MKLSERWLFPTAFWCLLLSGVAGLVYQVAWARYLALLLGHTSYAVVAVLVAFMGGLALGNAWLGRYADRLARPLALYAWLEIGIAIYGLVFPRYFDACQAGYVALAHGATPGSPWLLALKFAFSIAAILVPTTLMGGTLPVLTRLVTRSLGELRARVAWLYFVNSLGAVAGVAIADFWWVPQLGLEATVLGAAGLNAAVGAVALFVNAGLAHGTAPAAGGRRESEGTEVSDEAFGPFELRLAIAAAGISGFVAMLYEVVWTRLLALALGSSTHAFSIMLLTFIIGIATGAWIVARWRGLRRTFDAFGWAELALAGTLLGSMFFYELLPYVFTRLGAMVARAPQNHAIYQGLQFLVCFAVMFVPTLCLGMTLPLASRVATSELARTGRSVGLVFSVNTVGTVLGAALTGLVLLPSLGLAPTLALGVGMNLAIAVVVLMRRWRSGRWWSLGGALLAVVALVMVARASLAPTWDRAFSMGLWRERNLPQNVAEYRARVDSFDVKYHRDGAGSTVVVQGWRGASGREELSLRVNGKTDATSRGDLPTQLLAGHLPMLLHTNAEDVLVVGLGSGVTCGAVLTHGDVRRLDVVEISPEVYEAARTWFGPHNGKALEDSRVRVVLDDAKSFLKTAGRRYDAIVTEPSNPWMAGVAGVFSAEYYETCREALKPGGIVVQWVQIYETNDRTLETVLATFGSVFPFLSIWQTLPGDVLLLGTLEPARRDVEIMDRRFDKPAVTQDLRRADFYSLTALLGLQLVSEANGVFLVPPEAVRHSDYFPTLEYQAERAFFVRAGATLLSDFDETALRRPGGLLGEYLRRHPFTATDAQTIALLHTSFELPVPRIMRSVVERWRELAPESLLPVEYSAKLDFALPVAELEAQRMARVRDQMLAAAASEPEPLRMYSRHLMNAYRSLRSAFYQPPAEELRTVLERLAETDSQHRQSHLLRLAELAWDLGDDALFFDQASRAFVPQAGAPTVGKFEFDFSSPGHVLFLVIETLWRQGRFAEARGWADAAREGGFLDSESRYHSRRLDMVVRKAEATVGDGGVVGR